MSGPPQIFDRFAVRRNRTKAALNTTAPHHLIRDSRTQLLDRLLDVTLTFRQALVQGSHCTVTAQDLRENFGVEHTVCADQICPGANPPLSGSAPFAIADEEWVPFAPDAFDLVISELCLHWTNDLPGSLIQLRRTLKPDGLFLATAFGGQTLHELRDSWLAAESSVRGGVAPRMSPLLDVRDAGNLLVRAGFALPVTDTDTYTFEFDSLAALTQTLRGLGETNAVADRPKGLTTPRLWQAVEDYYRTHFADSSGSLRATFEVITMTGWAPDSSQQQPLSPGSAKARLADALGGDETPL